MIEKALSILNNKILEDIPNLVLIVSGILLIVFISTLLNKIRNIRLLKTVTKMSRGTKSERDLVIRLLKYRIPQNSIFHDLYLRKPDGKYAQIDLVVVSSVGMIVIEVKDYSGWIFGNGKNYRWTQVLAYGKEKYRLYNPVLQNKMHIEALKKQFRNFKSIPFFSVIVFYGNCELKEISFVPRRTYVVKSNEISKVMNVILKNNDPVNYGKRYEIERILRDGVMNGDNMEIQRQHIENVRIMLQQKF